MSSSDEPVAVEVHVTGFVPQYQAAHGAKGGVLTVPVQQSVVDGAHDFGEQEHRKFKPDTDPAAYKTKGGKAPVT
jgi:hypothetical protein